MNYWFFIGWGHKEYSEYIESKFNFKPTTMNAKGACLVSNGFFKTTISIWTKDPNDLGVLAHECTHAANRTLKKRGWKADLGNDEPQAHLIEWLVNEALK
jgi:hypothetical protein